MFKNCFKLKLLIIVLIIMQISKTNSSFNFESRGPDMWPHIFSTCANKMQSPIDIHDWNAVYDSNLKEFNFINYDNIFIWNATNDGLTGTSFFPLVNDSVAALKLNGSNFKETFDLWQLHFHWGENDYQGSDHFIDGKKYPLELHLVHTTPTNKMAVLAFLFTLSPENVDNPALTSIVDAVSTLRKKHTNTRAHFRLSTMLPPKKELKDYYRYMGSLTTPPCSEGLIWTIFETPIEISSNQMKSFHSNEIVKNFRHVQKLNGRKVYSSREVRRKNEDSIICNESGDRQMLSTSTLLLFTLIAYYTNLFL